MMETVKIPYKLKTKLRRLNALATKVVALERECMAEFEELGLVDDDLEFASSDKSKAAEIADYWVDATNGFGGDAETLIELLENMPLAQDG